MQPAKEIAIQRFYRVLEERASLTAEEMIQSLILTLAEIFQSTADNHKS